MKGVRGKRGNEEREERRREGCGRKGEGRGAE
jgi:hypothetical protein